MLNFSDVIWNVWRSYFLIIAMVLVLCFSGIFVLRQKQSVGSAQAHCLKGYLCKSLAII
jgi:ABC-type transporter Mla maintaining outer membrane lipid asymmetry permease subunit MlaE